VLAIVRFRVKAPGPCAFDLYETMLLNSFEQEIAHIAVDGRFTGTAPDEGFD
jgi:hypothetical protein